MATSPLLAPGPGGPARATPLTVRSVLLAWETSRAWRELAYLLVGAPLALAALVGTGVGLVTGVFLTVVVVGVGILVVTISASRHLGAVYRALAETLLGERVEAPLPRRQRPGVVAAVVGRLTDLAGWRAIAYTVVSSPLKVGGACVVSFALAMGGILALYPLLWMAFAQPQVGEDGRVHDSIIQFGDFYVDTWPRAIATSVVGIVSLLLLPWVVRGIVTIDRFAVRHLLGPGSLSRRMTELEETRAHAVDDSVATLRRIERDLHDGTQARLVALAMQLDLARERLTPAGGPDGPDGPDGPPPGGADLQRARGLLDDAHRNATEAIVELREVTRSIHPPALDRGLEPALTTLAARSRVPVGLRVDVPHRPSPAVETIAYFCVAELLTNVTKHSGAGRADVVVDVVGLPGGPPMLRLWVADDGRGGAGPVAGGGLAGLAERVRTIDGRMDISSPAGGPTIVTAHVPLA